ncbi:bifunctional riboflavin kinase/FAD synthetase [Hathewaya histolytica]|uniref:Riboflavin biosynthesis protein n=1 Tax=Hathewaya histolytica TaxID=1498 RepID=A0A4U9RCN2_HATHI|nr:bifunctional riboflavin kinase/FAD synthetase [Hathewaya histolytica]VTQ89515.1 bifunctional riboflavin kinase/FMN adenylyltransferase [Hathewaya histolytica]
MRIIEDNFKEKLSEFTYIALGSFDGIHRGHLNLVRKTVKLARENNCKSMIYTFKNHPMSIINKDKMPKLIQNNEEKVEILRQEGIDILNFVQFSKEYMKIKAKEFVEKLVKCYNVKGIVVGFNYKFGYKNEGNIELLKILSKKYNFQVFICEPIEYEGNLISSTNIRNLISNGKVDRARILLSRPFAIEGTVVEGKKLGRKLGFPTINLRFNQNKILPKTGVYYTAVKYSNRIFKGITDVGYNPTVNGKVLSIETYILDFNKEIYGEDVIVYFLERIRDEEKFDSLNELIEVLKKDKVYAEKRKLCL